MKIDALLCFQAVAKNRSFSNAADSLYISQSSLSKKIKSLEDELGGALFIRKSNSVVMLSPFGEYISSYINNILEDYDMLMSATDNYKVNRQKKLTIATYLNVAHSGLLKPITQFEDSQSNFYIETLEKDHSTLRQALMMHQVDICFAYSELIGDIPGYTTVALFPDPLILITSQEYAAEMNWRRSVNLSNVKEVRFCFPREDMEIFTFLINVCRSCGFIPQLTHSDVRLGTIRQYIAAGMRCTLQFESLSHSKFYGDQFKFLSLENRPHLTMAMYVECIHEKKIKQRFVNYILDHYKDCLALQ